MAKYSLKDLALRKIPTDTTGNDLPNPLNIILEERNKCFNDFNNNNWAEGLIVCLINKGFFLEARKQYEKYKNISFLDNLLPIIDFLENPDPNKINIDLFENSLTYHVKIIFNYFYMLSSKDKNSIVELIPDYFLWNENFFYHLLNLT